MAKYFKDQKPLLYGEMRLDASNLNAEYLQRLFEHQDELSLCIYFQGYPDTCMGYVMHVRRRDDQFELRNITNQVEMNVVGVLALEEILNHVCGAKYSGAAQAIFQRIRNDIGTVGRVAQFP